MDPAGLIEEQLVKKWMGIIFEISFKKASGEGREGAKTFKIFNTIYTFYTEKYKNFLPQPNFGNHLPTSTITAQLVAMCAHQTSLNAFPAFLFTFSVFKVQE